MLIFFKKSVYSNKTEGMEIQTVSLALFWPVLKKSSWCRETQKDLTIQEDFAVIDLPLKSKEAKGKPNQKIFSVIRSVCVVFGCFFVVCFFFFFLSFSNF